jgi:hypothetical protein
MSGSAYIPHRNVRFVANVDQGYFSHAEGWRRVSLRILIALLENRIVRVVEQA